MSLDITYSQNYLRSSSLVRFLLSKTSIQSGDAVIDIGAGRGMITQSLLELGTSVIAIEKDAESVRVLKERYARNIKVKIEEMDFLKYIPSGKKVKVFANIPFNYTSSILKKILSEDSYEETYLILQKEAAEKYIGQPYGSETLTSLEFKPFFEFKILHTLKPEDFTPTPKVTSVLLSITKKEVPLIEDPQLYKEFITYGFTQYKPNLISAYEKIFKTKQLSRLMTSLCFSKDTKLTGLAFEQWIKLFDFFVKEVPEENKLKVLGSIKKLKTIQEGVVKIHRTRKK